MGVRGEVAVRETASRGRFVAPPHCDLDLAALSTRLSSSKGYKALLRENGRRRSGEGWTSVCSAGGRCTTLGGGTVEARGKTREREDILIFNMLTYIYMYFPLG